MPCPISLLFINLHGSEYLVAAQLCPYGGGTGGGWGSRGREKFTTHSTSEELRMCRELLTPAREHGGLREGNPAQGGEQGNGWDGIPGLWGAPDNGSDSPPSIPV